MFIAGEINSMLSWQNFPSLYLVVVSLSGMPSVNIFPSNLKEYNLLVSSPFNELFYTIGGGTTASHFLCYHRYHDHWRNSLQRLVFLASLTHYLLTKKLLSRVELSQQLGSECCMFFLLRCTTKVENIDSQIRVKLPK